MNNLNTIFIKNFFFPIFQINRNENIIFYLNFLNKNQWWNYSKLRNLQLKKLKKMLIHADKNVSYYHKIFRDLNFKPENFRDVSDLNCLPILTKDIIKNNFKELVAQNYPKEKLILSSTGGSTGKPLVFYIDDMWGACNMGAAYRSWSWSGYHPGDKMVYLWGAKKDLEYKSYKQKILDFFLRVKKLNSYNLTKEKMEEYSEILLKFQPKIINSYSSAIYTFSKFLNNQGIKEIRPNAFLTTADMLFAHQRKLIEKTFNCEIFDYYSGSDTALHAAECFFHSGYHMSIENAVVEFLRDDEHVSSGEEGKNNNH